MLSVLFLLPALIFAQSGPNPPSSATNVGGGTNWSNPTRVFASEDQSATVLLILGSESRYLISTGFGFSIPATDIVDGIEVVIEKSRPFLSIDAVDKEVNLTKDGSALIGDNKALAANWPTSDTEVTYGGPSDRWGVLWTPTEINNSNFGLGILVSGTSIARIDHIEITVYHHSAPMPITLSSFHAEVTNSNSVQLHWTTATEINNDYFTIEKSTDAERFDSVANVTGSGNSTIARYYTFEDRKPHTGRSYYRLKQTDFNGTSTYSQVVKVDYDGPHHPALSIFPNPVTGTSFTFRIVGARSVTQIPMVIYDLQGEIIAQRTYSIETPGVIQDRWELESPLAPGLYLVKAGLGLRMTRKLVVQ